jgi:hypothetical protein
VGWTSRRSLNPPAQFQQTVTRSDVLRSDLRGGRYSDTGTRLYDFQNRDMLKSEHIRSLSVEIKRSSVLLAQDAAGVKVQEVIEDAVRRDRALDTFEAVQQRALDQLEARKSEDNQKLQQEADRVLNELRTKIQSNSDEVTKERERLQTWRLQKHKEEQRIADAVRPFVTENPITTNAPTAPVVPAKKPG